MKLDPQRRHQPARVKQQIQRGFNVGGPEPQRHSSKPWLIPRDLTWPGSRLPAEAWQHRSHRSRSLTLALRLVLVTAPPFALSLSTGSISRILALRVDASAAIMPCVSALINQISSFHSRSPNARSRREGTDRPAPACRLHRILGISSTLPRARECQLPVCVPTFLNPVSHFIIVCLPSRTEFLPQYFFHQSQS